MALTSEELQKIKSQKLAALRRSFKNIDKVVGKTNSVYFLQDQPFETVKTFSSGSLMLDIALGTNGIPLGRIIECYGNFSSGKTTIMLKAIAEAQKQGLITAFIDAEQSFSPQWAAKLGVNIKELILAQPDSMEDAFNVIDGLIDSGYVSFIVLDSVASLVPQQELDNDIGKQTIALIARGMSAFLRRITPKTAKNNCSVAFINQIRDNVAIMYGETSTTPGGKALKFYSSIRMEVSKVGGSTIKEKHGIEDVPIGHTIRCKISKNKLAPPFRKAEFIIYYDGREVDQTDELANVILTNGLIPKYNAKGELDPKGRKYVFDYEDEHLEINKKDLMADALRECPKIKQHFIDLIKSGEYTADTTNTSVDDDISEEEFFGSLDNDIKSNNSNMSSNISDAEEIETFNDEY